MKKREPDWNELSKIGERAESAKLAGVLDYTAWREFLNQATRATNGHPEFIEFLLTSFSQPGWIDRLMAEEKNQKRSAAKRHKKLQPAA